MTTIIPTTRLRAVQVPVNWRCWTVRPRVLLMDEPCLALDPTSTRRIEQTIVELASEVTIVIVTPHAACCAGSPSRARSSSPSRAGVIVEAGQTAKVFGSPEDPRASDYVNGRFG